MAILVTGGSGFIGSHTCIELLNAGYEIVVLDNLSNSHIESLEQVREITGKSFVFEQVDLLDKNEVMRVFTDHSIEAVIHFAGLKAVGESVSKPLFYYYNNVAGTLVLCEVMQQFGVKNLVFSSSATVYGLTDQVPISEGAPLDATNPYGRTKLMIEEILRDLCVSDREWSISLLRYFNPIGAHESGKIGEDPNGTPNNLIPYITQVAVGKLPKLQVFGDNYETVDGTGVRDYIHVVDLAKGHLKALAKVLNSKGIEAYNLGTGNGYSVLQVLHAFEQVVGVKIPFDVTDRRPGDVAISYADPSKAKSELGWKAEKDIHEMCRDAWNWQKNNVNGFRGKVLQ
ncbi:UDP-glucose 4-epimerase [Fictibacillus enclensis]|uniref:UDP-glucose 4-epimerase n=1 Tax=Fictibacillus enclensis TaxID=1017270 RepID=A0A0V8IZZ1_9BACL|nr:UDP-glucose 4-epimerase GalE [Fictibacillus enclensis]KSU80391.1 UDP-glucose 4-epimerase [Fictibacillus enclensis]SCC38791.1 UDP-glucose 4-epimerase [Fictibacillus enclensis]